MPGDDFGTASSVTAGMNATIAQASSQMAEDAAGHAACLGSMQGYRNDGATIEQARAYASCVREVYGSGAQHLIALKLLVAARLISTIVGVAVGASMVRGHKENSLKLAGGLLGGPAGCMLSMFVFGLGGAALMVLFS